SILPVTTSADRARTPRSAPESWPPATSQHDSEQHSPTRRPVMPDEYPQPPFDMDMPQTAEKVATFGIWLPAIAMFIASLVWWKRSGSPVYFLGMLGGLIACCNEPIADILVHCYHAEVDQQWTVFSSFGRDIPLWAV